MAGTRGNGASAALPDEAVRSALDFAFHVARARAGQRDDAEIPAEVRPLLRFTKLPATARSRVREAIEADERFREQLATMVGELAGDEAQPVDEIGLLWLRRPEGWAAEARRLADARAEAGEGEPALTPRRAERRRQAAEAAAEAARAEITKLRQQAERDRQRLADAQEAEREARRAAQTLTDELAAARAAARHAADREQAARAALSDAEAARDAAAARGAEAERIRDAVLAERAHSNGARHDVAAPADAGALAALESAARSARELAEALAAATTAAASRAAATPRPADPAPAPRQRRRRVARQPLALPGAALGDAAAAAEYLFRAAGVLVVVDGYNVAKLGWPQLSLEDQRELCIRALEDVARRWATDVLVVFDGADVPGASAGRRLVAVRFSPPGVTADDVIREEVARLPASRPVVVVTNDGAIVESVRRDGANVVSSDALLTAAGVRR